jgi:hypothetical protein
LKRTGEREGDLMVDEIEFFVYGRFGEVECVFEIIVSVDCVIVFLDMSFLAPCIKFFEMR